MMEAISQHSNIESSHDHEECNTKEPLNNTGTEKEDMANEELYQADIKDASKSSELTAENLEEISIRKDLDNIKSTETEENEANQSFAIFKEVEENCNEKEEAERKESNLKDDEKHKTIEYDDDIEDEMKSMHSPENAAEYVNVSKEQELFKSKENDKVKPVDQEVEVKQEVRNDEGEQVHQEEQIDQEAQVNQPERYYEGEQLDRAEQIDQEVQNDQEEQEAVASKVDKEQIQAEIEIHDSSDSSTNEVSNIDYETHVDNKGHENDDEHQLTAKSNADENSGKNEDEDKEIVSISDEESIQSINDKQDAEQIDTKNTNFINEKNIEQQNIINIDDESQDDMQVSQDIVPEEKRDKESDYLTANEGSQDKFNEEIKELEQPVSYKDENIENLNENNAAELTHNISRNSPTELLNGNEDSDDDLQIIDADEDSNQNKPQDEVKNIANEECDDEKPENVCDASLINVISNDNNLVNCIKRQFLKLDNTTTELPKLNGDHKVPETDQINTSVIEIHENSRTSESAKISEIELKRETLSSGEEDDNDKYNFESNLQIIDEDVQQLLVTTQTEASPHPKTIAAIEKSPMQPMQIDLAEDECSRSSIASSTATSSSHHLVIDDTETVTAKKSNKQRRNDKLTRKRKLSQNSEKSELSPQPKQVHLEMELELEPEPVVNTVLNVDSEVPSVNFQLKEDSKEISIPIISENLVAPIVLHKSSEALVQSPPTCSSPLLNSLLVRKQLETMDKLITTENKLNNTKYLCFNCKSGCFDSLIALNEHQRQCLANKSLLPPSIAPSANTPPQSPPEDGNGATPQQKNVSKIQLSENTTVEKLRYYKCSSCGTFHENWNLFLHIREIHKRHMCLYCIRMFPTAEKLSLHLEIKHDLEQNHFNSEEALRKSLADTTQTESGSENMFLMCCTCQHVFPQSEPFSDHICSEYMQACDLCGQKGRHTNQCKAQTEAKRSRVKKKAKAKESNSGRLQSLKSDAPHFMTPQSEPFPNPPQVMAPYCDNAPIQTTIPPSTSSQTQSHSQHVALQQQQNEDSNSSCNMIIDETCNNTNYSRITPYNPFKALDERERLEQQTALSEPPLPPDRYIGGMLEQAMEKPAPIQPLIVPKFKLRVPKEFQKSVDAAISSTESEDDEANEEDVDTSREVLPAVSTTLKVPQSNASAAESATESATEVPNTQEEADENTGHLMAVDEEDSLDEPNSKLARILQEIERTRLDIMRTKDALQTAKSPINASNQQRSATISQSSSRTGGERNWTPTPPASPNPQWVTPRRALSNNEKEENEEKHHHEFSEDFVPPRNLIPIENQERRDTTGSEIDMDIDETISGQPTMCIQRSASHQVTEDTKLTEEVKTEIINNQMDTSNENSSMNIDDFSGSKASAEEHSNTFGSDQSDHTQDRTIDEPPKEDEPPIVEEPKTYVPQQSPKAETAPAKATEKQDDHVDACVQENQLTENHEPPADGIEVADDDTIPVDLQLDRPLEKFQIVEFVRICLKAVYPLCLYCNHARRIAVNGKSLVLHLIAQHRFAATVDSITAEELQPGTIVTKLKSYLPELDEHFLNSTSYCTMGDGAYTRHFNERIFECFQCRFVTSTHKELYLHNRKMHIKTAILCFMCRANFFSFSEILCHICPGEPNKTSVFDVKFRCCLCDVDNIPSPFRLMVHLRKKHFACDVCLEDCRDQGRLSSHVWKHKLHHLCYRCGIAYRNKMDITKHLFWKHGTESIICKRCLQKRWRHVYHFCIPPSNFICDVCTLCFSKATYLKVHKRIHTGDLRYPCTEDNCELKFISRRLLLKHTAEHQLPELTEKTAGDVTKQEEESGQKSEEQISEEVKIKNEKLEDAEVQQVKDEIKGDESKQQDTQAAAVANKTSSLEDSKTVTVDAQKPEKRKKKKTKRNKESLEDLNLIAPNLSESDSSDDSDVESKSKSGEDALVPNVMLSPPSETEHEKESKDKSGTGKVLDIWKNFLQAQGGSAGGADDHRNDTDYTEDYYPTPNLLHVVQSDHDYCVMFKPVQQNHYGSASQTSPVKARKTTAKSPRRTSARRSDASSSSSGSSSSSDSSCSCGSNCSCSSSNSDSSSSSSSSDSSSAASNASRKRRRKKSERPHKKSESASPTKKHSIRELAKTNASGVADDDVNVGTEEPAPRAPSPPKEPLFYESDLETAESETDEEFYDEHPQKLASELLAQKRAQLMAQTRLSPSHNYDIVENSRPSTPSLPDEVAREKKVKLKKKKRERKSTSRSMPQSGSVPSLKLAFGNAPLNAENIAAATVQQSALPLEVAKSSLHEMLPSYDLMRQSTNITETAVTQEQQHASHQQLTPRPIGPQHHTGRMSEGSSCSDADASLKRSKRARRPNKFYGYTSDDENNMSGLGQPLMIGMRAIKPQPPPQLTWRKEDLPTPSKSVINNKIKTPRLPKTPGTLPVGPFGGSVLTPATLKKKRVRNTAVTPGGGGDKPPRKRLTKKAVGGAAKLPPIPTLKIRPSQIGLTPTNTAPNAAIGAGGTNHIPASQIYSSSKESDDEEEDSTDSSSDDEATQKLLLNTPVASTSKARLWNAAFQQVPTAATTATAAIVAPAQASVVFQASLVLPPVLPAAPPPPTPQASAFNQKIPPALLPNPDFATLQYFKANNIRYPIRPPAGARQAREGESVYCYCRCPYDEVSEMIACDGDNCLIEWFHFECVGIMVAPQGKWFCAECRPKYSEELYPASKA